MSFLQPSLADQAANLRTAILADEAPCWLLDAIHALIMAALARVFARLENMIRLWQSGQLPPPPAPRPPSRNSARASGQRRRALRRTPRERTARASASPPPAPPRSNAAPTPETRPPSFHRGHVPRACAPHARAPPRAAIPKPA